MPLESAEYIAGLVPTNPVGTDPKSQGDDHLTLIKKTLVQSFPGVDAECDFTPEQVNSWEERIALLEGVALAAVDVAGLNLVEFALPAISRASDFYRIAIYRRRTMCLPACSYMMGRR